LKTLVNGIYFLGFVASYNGIYLLGDMCYTEPCYRRAATGLITCRPAEVKDVWIILKDF
jgi:hypothetical protein